MTEREQLIALVEFHEGRRSKAYVDTTGNITVGVGRNLTGKGLSPAEIDLLRDNDLDECIRDLTTFPWFVALDPTRQRALTDARFNLGASGFRGFPKMIHALAIGDMDTAALELLNSQAAKQNVFRYNRLARMLRGGFDEIG